MKITIICFQNGCSYLFKLFTTRIRCYRSKKQTSQIDPTQLPPSIWSVYSRLKFENCSQPIWFLFLYLTHSLIHSHIIYTPQNDKVCVCCQSKRFICLRHIKNASLTELYHHLPFMKPFQVCYDLHKYLHNKYYSTHRPYYVLCAYLYDLKHVFCVYF